MYYPGEGYAMTQMDWRTILRSITYTLVISQHYKMAGSHQKGRTPRVPTCEIAEFLVLDEINVFNVWVKAGWS